MIDIKKKEDCVGCNACVQRCPKQCIDMKADEQGFLYPMVDLDRCIDCHLCEKVCPVLNQKSPKKPVQTYAAKNRDDKVRQASSSGGVFFALAEYVIREKNGVVFGARFDGNWEVVHDYAETMEEAEAFKGSKYVQSKIEDSFKNAEKFLKEGRTVLFSGTPCQTAALKLFLRKDWGERLITVDVVCHGVPSPGVWKKYLSHILRPKGADGKNTDFQSTPFGQMPVPTGIYFRNKRISWEKFGFSVHAVARKGDKNSDFQSTKSHDEEQELLFETLDKNIYMQGFLKDLYLRPSCYACPAKCGKSHSDITLADFWGIQKNYPILYKTGFFSLVMANNEMACKIMELCSIEKGMTDYAKALEGNPAIEHSARKPKQYTKFWTRFQTEGIDAIIKTLAEMRPSFIKRTYFFVRRIAGASLRKIGLKK